MSSRIDAIPGKRSAFAVLGRALLSPTPDAILQRIVETSAAEVATPMGLVSIVLEHVELFKAHFGLPVDLAAAGAVVRDETLCQFVVRAHDLVEIDDAASDPQLPQKIVEDYGIRSYLGDTVDVEGEAVGTLCVMDHQPRRFTHRDRRAIRRHAAEASRRMEELARSDRPPPGALRDRAVRPQFAELRNRLQPVLHRMNQMQIAAAEIGAVHRIAESVAVHPERPVSIIRLDAAHGALNDLVGSLDDLYRSVAQIGRAVDALETASLLARDPCSISEIVDTAATLAHHETKLVGGVRLPPTMPDTPVIAPRPVAVSALAAVLACMSHKAREAQSSEGIDLGIAEEPLVARVRVAIKKLGEDALKSARAALGLLLHEAPFVGIAHTRGAIEVMFTRV